VRLTSGIVEEPTARGLPVGLMPVNTLRETPRSSHASALAWRLRFA